MKKTPCLSRRRRALRRVLIAAAVLVLVNHIFHIGLLLPIQAIRQNEELNGIGRTSVVLRDRAPEIHKSHLIYLTESEDITMLSGAYLTIMGWMSAFGVPVDCSEPAPIHGGHWNMTPKDGPSLYCAFGRIDDPDIDYLKVQAQYEDWTTGAGIRRTAFEWGSSRDSWTEKEGKYYFLFQKYPMDWSLYPFSIDLIATGYDADGNEIARIEVEQGASSHFG